MVADILDIQYILISSPSLDIIDFQIVIIRCPCFLSIIKSFLVNSLTHPSIHSFTYSFYKYLLKSYFMKAPM